MWPPLKPPRPLSRPSIWGPIRFQFLLLTAPAGQAKVVSTNLTGNSQIPSRRLDGPPAHDMAEAGYGGPSGQGMASWGRGVASMRPINQIEASGASWPSPVGRRRYLSTCAKKYPLGAPLGSNQGSAPDSSWLRFRAPRVSLRSHTQPLPKPYPRAAKNTQENPRGRAKTVLTGAHASVGNTLDWCSSQRVYEFAPPN